MALGVLETVIFVEKSISMFYDFYTFSIHSIDEIVKIFEQKTAFVLICGIKQLPFATVLAQGYDSKTDGKR